MNINDRSFEIVNRNELLQIHILCRILVLETLSIFGSGIDCLVKVSQLISCLINQFVT
jgi:hypothetical protein